MLAVEIFKRLLARLVRVMVYHPVSSGITSFLLAALIITNVFPIGLVHHSNAVTASGVMSPAPAVQEYVDGLTKSFDARKVWASLSYYLEVAPRDGASPPDFETYTFVVDQAGKIEAIK